MDASRFDRLARHVAGRMSRRTAVKGGMLGVAAGALGASGRQAVARQATPGATPRETAVSPDLLPSWNDGPARQRILAFLNAVLDPAGDAYVDPADRVAAFDLDGTLWCEKPQVPQALFMLGYVRQQAEAHPELRTVQPYKAVWEQDTSYFNAAAEAEVQGDIEAINAFFEEIMAPLAGLTPAEYETIAQAFFDQSRHPELEVPYQRVTYQPMVDLIGALQAHEFDVYIVTGGGRDFVRVISEAYFGISRSNVIGSSVDLAYRADEQGGMLVRQNTMDRPFDNGPGKPIRIEMQVGRQPILVGGNSDGDAAMLAYAQEQHGQFFGLLVHHDDIDREYAYDEGAETALELAGVHNWTVASMKEDFRTVFPTGDV